MEVDKGKIFKREKKVSDVDKKLSGKQRLEICKKCDKYINSVGVCSVCKCFMPIKINIWGSNCPINKW